MGYFWGNILWGVNVDLGMFCYQFHVFCLVFSVSLTTTTTTTTTFNYHKKDILVLVVHSPSLRSFSATAFMTSLFFLGASPVS